jgi:hypothetical protein
MADVKRLAPNDRRQPTKPMRDQHTVGSVGRRRAGRHEAVRPVDDANSSPAGRGEQDRSRAAAASAAPRAARLVAALSGRRPESVISIERADGGWRVGVEVVEVPRIPDSADILAVYEVRLDADGDLISYRRVCRYARGHADWEPGR